MKLLKQLAAAALSLLLILSLTPRASAAEDESRFAGKSWDEVMEDFMKSMKITEKTAAFGYRNTVTGEEHFFNGDTYMVSGSMYKVPLNMAVARMVADGSIDFSTSIAGVSYEKLQRGSIVYSSNDYAKLLWTFVGDGTYHDYRRIIAPLMGEDPDNVDDMFYKNNYFTARQVIYCLNLLYSDSENYPGVIDNMKKAEPSKYFHRDERRFEIAHKYGFLDSTYHFYLNDCGIVYTDDPILLVCFTDNQNKAYDVLARYCTLMCDYTQYHSSRRMSPENALEQAVAALPAPELVFTRQAPIAVPVFELPTEEPEPTPEPTPAPEPEISRAAPPYLNMGLAFLLICALPLLLRRRGGPSIAVAVLLTAGLLGFVVIDLSPARTVRNPVVSDEAPAVTPEPRPEPKELLPFFFQALRDGDEAAACSVLSGYERLGLSEPQESELNAALVDALVQSYECLPEGELELHRDSARQAVTLRALDLERTEEALRDTLRALLQERMQTGSFQELYLDDGSLQPQLVEELRRLALAQVLEQSDSLCAEKTLLLDLAYADGRWVLCGNDALVLTLTGGIGVALAEE